MKEGKDKASKAYVYKSACFIYLSLLVVSLAYSKCSQIFSAEIGLAVWMALVMLSGPANLVFYGQPSVIFAFPFILLPSLSLPLVHSKTRFAMWLIGTLIYWLGFGGLALYAILYS